MYKLSINKVCILLKCHKSFFRNHPELRELIKKAKEKEKELIQKSLPFNKDFNKLSFEARKYEPKYKRYIKEMERLGKNWKIASNKRLSENLEIPIDILIEIIAKYCPFTRKEYKMQKKKEYFNIK